MLPRRPRSTGLGPVIGLAVETFKREAHPSGQVLNELRGVERQLGRVDRHLLA